MTPDPNWAERFLARIDTSGDCWEWIGTRARGYGVLNVLGRQMFTHRLSYLLHYGDLPPDSFICHHCDNRACCNPDHLYAGDVQTNSDDAVARHRLNPARGERQGHAVLTAEIVRRIRTQYATGGWSHPSLAQEYGVCEATVYKVLNRKTWRHVE